MAQIHVSTQTVSAVASMQRVMVLDLWLSLGLAPNSFDRWVDGVGEVEAWAILLAKVREIRPMRLTIGEYESEGGPPWQPF